MDSPTTYDSGSKRTLESSGSKRTVESSRLTDSDDGTVVSATTEAFNSLSSTASKVVDDEDEIDTSLFGFKSNDMAFVAKPSANPTSPLAVDGDVVTTLALPLSMVNPVTNSGVYASTNHRSTDLRRKAPSRESRKRKMIAEGHQHLVGKKQRQIADIGESSSSAIYNPHPQIHNSPPKLVEPKKLLFEKLMSASDVGDFNRLVIPRKFADAYLPCLKVGKGYRQVVLNFSDKDKKLWDIKYEFWKTSQSYVLTKGWKAFVKHHDLHVKDRIRMYEENVQYPGGENRRYSLDHVIGPRLKVEKEKVREDDKKVVRLFGADIVVEDPCRKDGGDDDAKSSAGSNSGGAKNTFLRANGGLRRIRNNK